MTALTIVWRRPFEHGQSSEQVALFVVKSYSAWANIYFVELSMLVTYQFINPHKPLKTNLSSTEARRWMGSFSFFFTREVMEEGIRKLFPLLCIQGHSHSWQHMEDWFYDLGHHQGWKQKWGQEEDSAEAFKTFCCYHHFLNDSR